MRTRGECAALVIALAILGSGCSSKLTPNSQEPLTVVDRVSGQSACLAVLHFAGYGTPPYEKLDRINIAAWDDGTIVWSENRAGGGRPYRRAKIDPRTLASHVRKIKDEIGRVADGSRSCIAADDSWVVIEVQVIGEWFDLAASFAYVGSMDSGLAFRDEWFASLEQANALLPTNGEPMDASTLGFKMGELLEGRDP